MRNFRLRQLKVHLLGPCKLLMLNKRVVDLLTTCHCIC
jgi:hypothetical protein